jgi:NDP-sugar pyrophosphorylase family protein
MSKTAVILAGGKGMRLRPYTAVLPKPLLPIGNYPIVEVIVRQLAAAGFDHIIMAVNHQADIIKSYFNSGDKWGIHITYSMEKHPLGTMGPLRLLNGQLPDHFMVLNGDILTDLDFAAFHDLHTNSKSLFTIAAQKREVRSEFGVLKINADNKLIAFHEKPIQKHLVSMGVYMVSKKVVDFIQSDSLFGFDDLMHDLLNANCDVDIMKHEGLWLDIGRPDDYIQAIDLFKEQQERFLGAERKAS